MKRRFALTVAGLLVLGSLGYSARASTSGDHGILFVHWSKAAGEDIYLWKPGRTPLRLTWGRYDDSSEPSWSPDGRMIAFSGGIEPASAPGNCPDADNCEFAIWVMRANGSHKRLLAAPGPSLATVEPSWSPDGHRLVVVRDGPRYPQLVIVSLSSGRARTLGVRGSNPAWGPHGIAFAGRGGIRLLDPQTGRSRLIAHSATLGLAWSPDGSRLVSLWQETKSQGIERPTETVYGIAIYSYAGRELSRFRLREPNPKADVCGVTWAPDGGHLLLTTTDLQTKASYALFDGRLYEVDTQGNTWQSLVPRPAACGTSWR